MNLKKQHTLKTPAKLRTRRLSPPQWSLLCPLPATTLTLYPKDNYYLDFKYHGFVLPSFELYINGIIQYVLICVWFLSLHLRVTNCSTVFYCRHISLLIYPFYC